MIICMTKGVDKPGTAMRRAALTKSMTEEAFDNGYWYAVELREFAITLGIPSSSKLRKDQLEAAILQILREGKRTLVANPKQSGQGPRDVDRGLKLDLAVVNYTSNRETKSFIEREAAKLDPGFKRVSGTRYLLNRWREDQIAAGRRITYRDLVLQAIALNKSKTGPLRAKTGRYINFISDFMAENKGCSHADAVKAWHEVKSMDVPKTYLEWAKARRRNERE
jgi:SAP domain-containing new25